VLTRDPEQLAAHAAPFLAARPSRNILATVLESARAGHYRHARPVVAYARDGQDQDIVAAALRTPPWPLLASGFDDPLWARMLLERWLEEEPELPGVSAEPPTARAIAEAFTKLTGRRAELEFEEAMHQLSVVRDPARPATGELRPIREPDRETLIEWEIAFGTETGLSDGAHAARTVERRLREEIAFVWEDGGRPVCLVGFNPPVAGVVRIGPVYTPPEHRNRGYATSAVAAASRRLLERGAERCMLLTDLANPTSNRIYASIGYVRFGDWEQYRFTPRKAHTQPARDPLRSG
jgi:predicted GNAT family acetyltransferase